MPPKKLSNRPSAMETIDLISGPRVDIYVGADKKHYGLPKALLCYHSKYFDRCFNGNFAEGVDQTLSLPEDSIADFEMLLEYMLRGVCKLSDKAVNVGEPAKIQCLRLLTYADKYEVSGIHESLYEPLKNALSYKNPTRGISKKIPAALVTKEDIELIFRITPEGSVLRSLIVDGGISTKGMRNLTEYEELEKEVDGYASLLVRQVCHCYQRTRMDWLDPLTNTYRSD